MRSLAAPPPPAAAPSQRSRSSWRLPGRSRPCRRTTRSRASAIVDRTCRALQYLLRAAGARPVRHGVSSAASTQAAVVAHQKARGLPATGIVNDPTWRSLDAEPVDGQQRRRRPRPAAAAQRQAQGWADRQRHLRSGDARRGPAFQRHMTSTSSGSMDAFTWRRLLWHFEPPVWGSTSGLCDYSVGNGPANWGTGAAIGQLRDGREAHLRRGPRPRRGRGHRAASTVATSPATRPHEQGLDVDVRPMRDGQGPMPFGDRYRSATYDRAATRALVEAIRATAPGHVKLIYFNDPVLIREGLTRRLAGHDDHLHVRYCEASHPVSAYRCGSAAGEAVPPPTPNRFHRAERSRSCSRERLHGDSARARSSGTRSPGRGDASAS